MVTGAWQRLRRLALLGYLRESQGQSEMHQRILGIEVQRPLIKRNGRLRTPQQPFAVTQGRVGDAAEILPDIFLGSAGFSAHTDQISADVVIQLTRQLTV